MVDRARAAHQAGLDSLFVGDHHATPVPYYQNSVILARMLAVWGDRPAGALYLLPLWNPVLLAEQVGTLASVASGRFVLQCALGAGRAQFAAMGVRVRERVAAFEEALSVIRRLLAGESVTSERFDIQAARIAPLPPEPVEVWIGAVAEVAIDRTARLGDGWLGAPQLVPEAAREAADLYRERCAACGRSPSAVAIRRDVYVGESDAEAHATAGPIVDAGYRGFARAALIVGGRDTVEERLRELDGMGYTDVIVRNLVTDQAKALACIERLGEVRGRLADDINIADVPQLG